MTVVSFPLQESRAKRIEGIEACLHYLQHEARALGLPMLSHLVGVAREEAREAMAETTTA